MPLGKKQSVTTNKSNSREETSAQQQKNTKSRDTNINSKMAKGGCLPSQRAHPNKTK